MSLSYVIQDGFHIDSHASGGLLDSCVAAHRNRVRIFHVLSFGVVIILMYHPLSHQQKPKELQNMQSNSVHSISIIYIHMGSVVYALTGQRQLFITFTLHVLDPNTV